MMYGSLCRGDLSSSLSSWLFCHPRSLGLVLQRQLQAQKVAPEPTVQAKASPESQKPAALAKDASEGGVDELFAPRTHTVRVARSKALTRPQRKVMADVMASMRTNPRGSAFQSRNV